MLSRLSATSQVRVRGHGQFLSSSRQAALAMTRQCHAAALLSHARLLHNGITPRSSATRRTPCVVKRGNADIAHGPSRMKNRKVAIVTGASSGIGEELARDLVKRGWQVAMADINRNEQLSRELGEAASFHKTDVSDYSSQAKTFQEVWGRHGRIDALLANAGITDKSSIYILNHRGSDEIPPEPDLSCTDVDYKGVVYGTQLAIHFMRKNGNPGGSIVATASIAALHPHETYPEYDGAKAAVVGFVRATSRLLKIKENIRINVVLPGIVATNIIPPEMVAAVSAECLTPVSTIVAAYNKFLGDENLHGQGLECSAEKMLPIEWPVPLNGRVTRRAVAVWDPLFKMYHHESSQLPDAIV